MCPALWLYVAAFSEWDTAADSHDRSAARLNQVPQCLTCGAYVKTGFTCSDKKQDIVVYVSMPQASILYPQIFLFKPFFYHTKPSLLPLLTHLLSGADILTCHDRKSTGVTNNINDGSITLNVPVSHANEPTCLIVKTGTPTWNEATTNAAVTC